MLRELVTYVPQTSKINNKISKNWVRVLTTSRRGDGEAHIGCFGPICAKILARLYGANWSTKNGKMYHHPRSRTD
jgi:hypothetical protein